MIGFAPSEFEYLEQYSFQHALGSILTVSYGENISLIVETHKYEKSK
jgi:hypothetical protein